ncbi:MULTISPECIES: hypothetical protein [Streptomyces]|uniref:Uncharacterized protein n=3 Tax=Streptomyces diastaticus group TaxID=2849069 RepID=A0A8H9HKG7_9ACTN|nr:MULTISPECIES: hypothetical protein [Streptomyces]NEE60700.1 hypothetical protein [Streptomyces sp. SID8455]PJM82969.1 hypothetical protein CH313_13385 [Streptomyces sp. TSRI0384-2]QNE82017.1 hypothetical protein F0345_13565 [Streptomyces rutgersensis]WPR51992.1 hypothetical protein SJI45_14040 [Streptomyces sp. S399]GFH70357.1 hypothetical protein Sdia_11250 [Streptomyces diastaticus subsp. diastaticus]
MHSYGTGEAQRRPPTAAPVPAPDVLAVPGPVAAPVSAVEESALLDGGPAHGTRLRVLDRPAVVQVTYPCRPEDGPTPFRADALYVYRRDPRVHHEPLRYGYDHASP